MEWKLTDDRKVQYEQMLKGAQDLEATIGSSQYRMSKLIGMRAEVDAALKEWWDNLIKEMNLPEKRDFMITRDGVIKDVTKPAPGETELNKSMVGTNAAELK